MADLKLEFGDETAANEKIGGDINPVERKLYTVTSPVGINKNGQHYPQGAQVPLDEQTARNFASAGDVSTGDQTNG
jgi:hypothetical protein